METPEAVLIENLQVFVAFARKRLRNPDLAEDVVQESLLKALQAERKPATSEDVIAWFYRILRRSIIDIYRRDETRKRMLEKFEAEFSETPDAAAETELCRCFKSLVARMRPQYRNVLEQIDLGETTIADFAKTSGESVNNVTVRLHRARQQLRKQVEQACKVCSAHGCIDCTCENEGDECQAS